MTPIEYTMMARLLMRSYSIRKPREPAASPALSAVPTPSGLLQMPVVPFQMKMYRPPPPTRPLSCRQQPLTLERASVIVISSTDQPSRLRDDAHALPQPVDRRTQHRSSPHRHHCNLQSILR